MRQGGGGGGYAGGGRGGGRGGGFGGGRGGGRGGSGDDIVRLRQNDAQGRDLDLVTNMFKLNLGGGTKEIYDLTFPAGTTGDTGSGRDETRKERRKHVESVYRQWFNGGKDFEKGDRKKFMDFKRQFIFDNNRVINIGAPVAEANLKSRIELFRPPKEGEGEGEGDAKRRKGNDGKAAGLSPGEVVEVKTKHVVPATEALGEHEINIILNSCADFVFKRHGRNYFKGDTDQSQFDSRFTSQIRVLEGYDFTAKREMINGQQQVFLQVDALTKVISKTTALHVITRIAPDLHRLHWDAPRRRDVTCTREERCDACQECRQWLAMKKGSEELWSSKEQRDIVYEFMDRTVFTQYNDMSYKIEAVRFDMSPQNTFKARTPQSNGERVDVSFADYLQKYNVQITNFDQPMFQARHQRDTVFLVPECCLMTDIPESVKASLPGICSKKPGQRYPAIKDFTRTLLANPQAAQILESAEIVLGEEFVSVTSNAVELDLPEIVLAGREATGSIADRATCFSRNGWGRETQRMDFKAHQSVEKYMVVTFDERDERVAKEWAEEMMTQLTRARAPVQVMGKPNYQALRGVRHVEIMQRLEAQNGIPTDANGEVQIFWYCLLSNGDERDYLDAKAYALTKGIQSQCVNLSKHQRSRNTRPIMSNCTKQNINKHGNLVWWAKVNKNRLPSLAGKKILMLALDMSHLPDEGKKSRTSREKNSMAAMVACTIDPQTSNVKTWSDNTATTTSPDIYLAQPLAKFLVDACDAIHGPSYMPEVVIFYRDGLTMNHKAKVTKGEIEPLQEALKRRARELDATPPQFVFALVNKDGRGRFFNTDKQSGTAYNAPPGTAVNTSLPGAEEQTFQLIPNHETLSTAKPVTYIIMANTDLSQDDQIVSSAAGVGSSSSPATDSPESPVLQAVRGVSEVVHRTADSVRTMVGAPSPDDLAALLTRFTNECEPYILTNLIPKNMLRDLTQGLLSFGWDAAVNRPVPGSEPPALAQIQAFFHYGQQACEDEVRRLEPSVVGERGRSAGSTEGSRGPIPILDLQNFSYAMCFCESSLATTFTYAFSDRRLHP